MKNQMKDKAKNSKREREAIARIEKTLRAVRARKTYERRENGIETNYGVQRRQWSRKGNREHQAAESRPEEESNGECSSATRMASGETRRGRDREVIRRGKEVKREGERECDAFVVNRREREGTSQGG